MSFISLLLGVTCYTAIVTEPIFVLESAVTKTCNVCNWLWNKRTAGRVLKSVLVKA